VLLCWGWSFTTIFHEIPEFWREISRDSKVGGGGDWSWVPPGIRYHPWWIIATFCNINNTTVVAPFDQHINGLLLTFLGTWSIQGSMMNYDKLTQKSCVTKKIQKLEVKIQKSRHPDIQISRYPKKSKTSSIQKNPAEKKKNWKKSRILKKKSRGPIKIKRKNPEIQKSRKCRNKKKLRFQKNITRNKGPYFNTLNQKN